jgi:hypothetical protein
VSLGKGGPLWSTIAWLAIDYRSQFSELRWYSRLGVLHDEVGEVPQAIYRLQQWRASKKREANVQGWYEIGRVAGIFVVVYFGCIVHGKHAVDASALA